MAYTLRRRQWRSAATSRPRYGWWLSRSSAGCPVKRLRPPYARRQMPRVPLGLHPPCALLHSNCLFSLREQYGDGLHDRVYGSLRPHEREGEHPLRVRACFPFRTNSDVGVQPRRAASMVAMSIFFIVIIASKARFASPPPAASALVSARGMICQERPQRSFHQPHWLSVPPLPTIAFQ